MAENPRFNNSGMFTGVSSDNYSDIEPNSTSEVLATQGNVINSIKVFWNKLRAKLAYAVTRPNFTDAVGGHYQPVYIDEHGVVQVCAPETIGANIERGSSINIGNTPIHPGKTICVQLHGSLSESALPLKIGNVSVIYPSGASVYSTNVHIEGTYLFTYMAGGGNKWILISSMNIVDGTNNGLMTAAEHKKLKDIQEGANNYSLPAATSSGLGGVQLGYTENGQNYKVQKDDNNNLFVNVPWTDTNTHDTAYLRAGTKDTNANNSAGDGATYLKVVDNGAISSQVLIKGSNGAKVTSDDSGITIEGPGTIPSYKILGLVSEGTNFARNSDDKFLVRGSGTLNDSYFLNAKGKWTKPTVAASMGRMSVSMSNGALDMGSNLNATLHVTYNGSPIQFAFISGGSYRVSNSSGGLSISGVKASSAITNETTAVIVPMGNLSLKPQVLHFITKDSVEFLD